MQSGERKQNILVVRKASLEVLFLDDFSRMVFDLVETVFVLFRCRLDCMSFIFRFTLRLNNIHMGEKAETLSRLAFFSDLGGETGRM